MSIYQLWKGRRGGGIGAVQEIKWVQQQNNLMGSIRLQMKSAAWFLYKWQPANWQLMNEAE